MGGNILDQNKIITQVFTYWRSMCMEDRLPSRADIIPADIKELLPFLLLADVGKLTATGAEINLRLTGTHIDRVLEVDLTGCPIGGFDRNWLDFVIGRDFLEAAEQRSAIMSIHELRLTEKPYPKAIMRPGDKAHLRYQRLILPLSTDGQRVDMLLGALVADIHVDATYLWRNQYSFKELSKQRLPVPYSLSCPQLQERAVKAV